MRVFITGASGYVGRAIAGAFVHAGHEVTGLHHSPGSVERVRRTGAHPVQADIADPSEWLEAARDHHVLVHAALDYGSPVETDLVAVDSLRQIVQDSVENRQLIYTSGCWVLGDTGEEPVDETASVERPAEVVAWRPSHEEQVLGAADETLVTTVVRPGMVYGDRGGLVVRFFDTAEEEGSARYVGDGENRWSLVHRDDLGRLYVKIAEHRAGGVFHGVDGKPVKVRDAARAASHAAGARGAVESLPIEEAREELGPVADAMTLDQALVTSRASDVGWMPTHRSFVESAATAYEEWKAGGSG
ncbi:MAG: NAD-dependent epimerase/dehydratase family protein [Gemmatimonadetes bacterium]|nr:NAD-dependent epimerase/dehydratase family protein [Gemmatimonadota bacterium]